MSDTVADAPGTPTRGNGGPPARLAAAIRDPLPWPEFVRVAETLEETGFDAMFLPEIAGREAFSSLAAVAGNTERLRLASGVVTTVSRSLQTVAMAAATVQEISGGRFVLGLGSGPSDPGALSRLRATVLGLRGLFAGDRVETERGSVRLHAPPPRPVPIWLGALGPRAVRLAGELADGVLLNWCTPDRVAQARAEVAEGARAAGRDPSTVTIAAYIRACVGLDASASLAVLREATGEYAAIPAYRRQFERSGLAAEAAAAAAAHRDGRPEAVPETLVRAVAITGDAEDAGARLRAYRDAGVDLPVIYPVLARDRSSSLLGTLFALAPRPVLDP